MRAIDLHSRYLAREYELTTPQLICMRILEKRSMSSLGKLAEEMSISQATLTGIVDRLSARKLVTRRRKSSDRRSIVISLTQEGKDLVRQAPSPLQESFTRKLRALPSENLTIILAVLRHIVRMMDAEEVDAAPVLTTGPTDTPAHAVQAFLDPAKDSVASPTPSPSSPPSDPEPNRAPSPADHRGS